MATIEHLKKDKLALLLRATLATMHKVVVDVLDFIASKRLSLLGSSISRCMPTEYLSTIEK